ncbi:hypothetical protein [Nocardia acidivorans]|uniref:hypothetical protein n=1 Tax=Nocardia acidivorans TaxID=404580 RepID=UPI0008328436|nr:hypothetical protein [Nocardia acidivorans]
MTIDITHREMTSDITPEFARRAQREDVWSLSWLPEQRLTRAQAHAGMELDEILSDPQIVFDDAAHSQAAERAARLGILVEHAVVMLAQRMAERMHYDELTPHGTDAELPESIMRGWYVGTLPPGALSHAASGARSQHLWA